MTYRLAADVVLLAHFAFIAFAVLGGLLALRRRWIALVHVPAAAWSAFVVATGRICPLTYIENALRTRAGASGYPESFIEHYLLHVIYPPGLTAAVQTALAVAVIAINAAIYARFLKSHAPAHA